jgi:hypothetical protein
MPSREEYRAKLQEIRDRWRLEIDSLRAEAEQLEGDDRDAHEQRIAKLQGRVVRVQAKLDQLNEQGEALWGKLKAEVEAILKSMGEGLEKVAAANETDAIRKKTKD